MSHNATREPKAGRVCFVSGGSGGIGSAVCKRVVSEGGRVVVADRDETAARKLVEELGEAAYFVECDVKSERSIVKAFELAAEHFGALHSAVMTAGIVYHRHATPLTEYSTDEFDDTLAVNLRGSYLCLREAAKTMKKLQSQQGSIVLVASVAGIRGLAVDPGYAVSKFGVVGLTQIAAAKLVKDGIRVNCVSPTSVSTPMMIAAKESSSVEETAMASAVLNPLLRREVEPEELAGIIHFLTSEAALNINGVNLPVDQGWAAGACAL